MSDHIVDPRPPKVPDYRMYKVEDCPQLVNVQKKLELEGLKDPWLRNEVWRYPPETLHPYEIVRRLYFRGIKYGFAAFVVTVIGEKIYHHFYPEDQHSHSHK